MNEVTATANQKKEEKLGLRSALDGPAPSIPCMWILFPPNFGPYPKRNRQNPQLINVIDQQEKHHKPIPYINCLYRHSSIRHNFLFLSKSRT